MSPNIRLMHFLCVQGFFDDWNGIVIGESKIEAEKSEQIKQINLPDFRKKYKVKMRVRDAGRLQPPRFSDPEKCIIGLSECVDTIGMRKFQILMNCPRVILFTIVQYRCRVPAFHLLNEYSSETTDFPLSVVEFHRLYALPKEYLQSIAYGAALRLRLLPPYREQINRAC